jgi:hypothetical protein
VRPQVERRVQINIAICYYTPKCMGINAHNNESKHSIPCVTLLLYSLLFIKKMDDSFMHGPSLPEFERNTKVFIAIKMKRVKKNLGL